MDGYTPVRIAYNKYEPVSGKIAKSAPIIFCHGLSVTKEYWADIPQIVANETKRKVYSIDARNHGDSEWSDEWSIDIHADDVFHFMDTVGEEKAILVGHSMGGTIVMKAALKKPERIEGIIVEDMSAKLSPDLATWAAGILKIRQKLVQDIPPEMNEEEATKFCFEQYPNYMPKEMRELMEKQQQGVKPKFFFSLTRDSNGRYANKGNFDAMIEGLTKPESMPTEMKGTYNGPAHFIYGKLSVLFNISEDADLIKQLFPKAEFTGIENATHNVHPERPEEFTEALLKALA